MGLVSELRRRNVLRMAVLYVVAAWLIMQVAGVLMDLGGLPAAAGPWLLAILGIGFPIALAFSWFYELTPEGLALEKNVPEAASITHVTGRRMDFIVIAVLSAGLILFAYDKWWPSGPREKSIAVLPFVNMSDNPGQEYFSDGISEELLNVLSKIPDLRVTARTSSFQFKGENRDVIEIGRKLNAAFILEGSVRKAGRQVRITAQLIDAGNGFHLWSDTYDRELEDIFAVQDEISAAITGALKEHLGLQVSEPPRVFATPSTEAYEAYLRGRYLVEQRAKSNIEWAVREFEKAIALDPDYALAHAELAIATFLLSEFSYGSLSYEEVRAKAAPHIEQALVLNPVLAEAHLAKGFLLFYEGRNEESIARFKRAIQINPNYSLAYTWIGSPLNDFGRYAEIIQANEMAARLNPLSIPATNNYVLDLIRTNRLDDAERELEKILPIWPHIYANMKAELAFFGGEWASHALGNLEATRPRLGNKRILAWGFAAIGLEQESLALSESNRYTQHLRMLGRVDESVATIEAYFAQNPRHPGASSLLGLNLATAGDFARARPLLEDAWQSSGRLVSQGWFTPDCAAALIVIRHATGDNADELLAAIRDDVRRYREAGLTRTNWEYSADYESGVADYLAGKRETGLALIRNAAADGYFVLPNAAYLQALYDDPGFAPIREMQATRQVRERQKFLSIVCTDNPYAEYWQPAEGTCERFAAAGGT